MSGPEILSVAGPSADMSMIAPIGIPLGWSNGARDDCFIVRRGKWFCYLDREAFTMWDAAWRGGSETMYLDHVRTAPGAPKDLRDSISRLCEGRLLLRFSGDWRSDWPRASSIRVLPRMAISGQPVEGIYRLPIPSTGCELRLSWILFLIWSHCDGDTSLREAVDSAAASTGMPLSVLQQAAHSLVVGAFRAGVIFLDCNTDGGGGG